MIKVSDLIEWAQVHAVGRSVTFPEGWISGAELRNLGELVLKDEPAQFTGRFVGNRENLIKAWQDVTTTLLALEGVGQEIPDHIAALAMTRAIWYMMDWIVHQEDKPKTANVRAFEGGKDEAKASHT